LGALGGGDTTEKEKSAWKAPKKGGKTSQVIDASHGDQTQKSAPLGAKWFTLPAAKKVAALNEGTKNKTSSQPRREKWTSSLGKKREVGNASEDVGPETGSKFFRRRQAMFKEVSYD